ncbi:PAS domain-containing protein [Paenibacillus sp. JX-17]|uniref:PAS domain-containing protein n=1 Tax=Paenibacillus lacisoli TaxID=3064525 RepID=A0ABT9CDD2_9BACL|nr:PAS domain-containing protein [Paenibacillus sp. JX-17]
MLEKSYFSMGPAVQSLACQTVTTDRLGVIHSVNQAWQQAWHPGEPYVQEAWHGRSYFQVINTMTADHIDLAAEINGSLEAVLAGHSASCTYEFRSYQTSGPPWLLLQASPLLDPAGRLQGMVVAHTDITLLMQRQLELEQIILNMQGLRGFLPICAVCKNIRDDSDAWHSIESYMESHSQIQFTHDICPHCIRQLYPKYSSILDRLD